MECLTIVIASGVPELATTVRLLLSQRLPKVGANIIDFSDLVDFPSTEEVVKSLNGQKSVVFLADPSRLSPLLNDTKFIEFLAQLNTPWLQSTWAGVELIIRSTAVVQGAIYLTRVGGIFGQQMAEYTLGMIISRERDFPLMAANQQRAVWHKIINYRKLNQLTLAILGAGDIGAAIARSAKLAFNMTVRFLLSSSIFVT